jgi:hypothetical protein
LTENELTKVCGWVIKGAKLYVGRDYSGRAKIKVVHGPLGLFTDRYQCEDRDIEELNRRVQDYKSQHA